MITGVAKVALRASDQQVAVEFWNGKLGFEVLRDETYGDERWIEVATPDGTRLVLDKSGQRWPDAPSGVPDSPLFFVCDDVLTTYQELIEAGVQFVTEPVKMHFGWWAMFQDPDGHRYALEQADEQQDHP